MLEHPQISISHEQNRAKSVRQSTVFRLECLVLSALELEKKKTYIVHFFYTLALSVNLS